MAKNNSFPVGIIGLNEIGIRIAKFLYQNENHIYVWNPAPKSIPNFLGSIEEVTKLSYNIQIFISDKFMLQKVISELKQFISHKHTIINHATLNPKIALKIFNEIKETGAKFINSPFSGDNKSASKGELIYYVGCDDYTLESSKHILEKSSKKIVYTKNIENASIIKIAINILLISYAQGLSEILKIISSNDINIQEFKNILSLKENDMNLILKKINSKNENNLDSSFSLNEIFKNIEDIKDLSNNSSIFTPFINTLENILFKKIQENDKDENYFNLISKSLNK